MKKLVVLSRGEGLLLSQNIDILTDEIKSEIEKKYRLPMTHFGICWIEYDNYIIYTNYSQWQWFIDC